MIQGVAPIVLGRKAERALRACLEAHSLRVTRQRRAIYAKLQAAGDGHPTADDVYAGVKPALPDVSLATVYKTLETLVACGMATKWNAGDGPARFDWRTDPHYHARCTRCGKLWDIPLAYDDILLGRLFHVDGLRPANYRIEVVGLCDACAASGVA